MNEREVLRLLNSLRLKSNITKSFDIKNLIINLQNATVSDLVFYNLNDDSKSIEIFKERYKKSTKPLLVIPKEIEGIECISVEKKDFLKAQKILADKLYPLDLSSKKIVGVTGTNGKTTTVYLAMQIAKQNGLSSFSIGSLGINDSDKKLVDLKGMTTPAFIDLRKYLYKYFSEYDVCFMEVSSHALKQDRLYGISFDAGAWTSFSQDHLDFHPSIEDYFNSKLLFPKNLLKKNASFFVPSEQFELKEKLKNIEFKETTVLKDRNIKNLPSFFKVQYNKEDLEIALNLVESILPIQLSVDLSNLKTPEGRFEIYNINNKTAIIDSAHTPDAFENILSAISETYPNQKRFILFGCGGDRDSSKRSQMGKIASKFADTLIITSDNPRYEDPQQIIDHILDGVEGPSKVFLERDQAVSWAVNNMKESDLLILLGKGPENYILMGDNKIEYSDLNCFIKHANNND